MSIEQEMIDADLDRQFADWGVTVVHQSVAAVFDPDTLVNEETVTETEITALITTNEAATAVGTGGQYLDPEVSFTVRTGDLPATTQGEIRRLVYLEQVFDVIGVDVFATGRVTILHCRKRVNI